MDGAISGVQVGCVCATIGMMVQTFNASGIGIKLTSGIETWSGGSLLIVYVASIVAGMVGVTVAAYFTAAAFAVPALVKMGVPFAVAHFFIVYPASFATITPPVALASLVASRIANTKYGTTALESCKVAAVGFLTPFLFIYSPALLLTESFANPWTWIDLILILILMVSAQFCWVGYCMTTLNMAERLAFLGAAAFICVFVIQRHPIWMILALAIFAGNLILQFVRRGKEKAQAAAAVG